MSDIPDWLNDNEYTKDLDDETKRGILSLAHDLGSYTPMNKDDAVELLKAAFRTGNDKTYTNQRTGYIYDQ